MNMAFQSGGHESSIFMPSQEIAIYQHNMLRIHVSKILSE